MKLKHIPVKKYLGMALLGLGLCSCSGMLEVEPVTELNKDNYYQNEFDADAAVIGVYGEFLKLAEYYVVLNEVRADLMEPTFMADQSLIDLSNHSVVASDDNKYADPKPFYRVILNCNEVLEGLRKMRDENRITEEQFSQRYSDVGAVRSWVYLQLGIHFGEVPYVTESIVSINDVNNPALFPQLALPELIDELIKFMESLPYLDRYPSNIGLVGTSNGYDVSRFFIPKRGLLGELYLWNGNYTQAAEMYRYIMETASRDFSAGGEYYNNLRIGWGGSGDFDMRYDKENDIRTLVNSPSAGWKHIFGIGSGERYEKQVWTWVIHYDSDFAPEYPFVRLFSNSGRGEYQLMPSKSILEMWKSETQWNDFEFDARGMLSTENWGTTDPEIGKYTVRYDPVTEPLKEGGKWFLERAASVHLKFAEAANRDDLDSISKLSRALINEGIPGAYRPEDFSGDDVTEIMNTLFYPYPYDFDGRQGNFPYYRGPWYRHIGIRGRAYLPPKQLPEEITSEQEEKEWTEDLIIDEMAKELAFEGHRWPQLLRIAMRRNDPSVLADRVYDKMSKSNNPETVGRAAGVRAKLMAGDWFLPFHWEE
ncbi:RagB/SusD family nutrient uptake outer membrane protein [Echinicola soli]|uniref:RagB/SusD family nutrient uptake outer membrane protein n=1 Tax=Echinicola soli TaxID=2591634 RepID=A0A514CH13_9BACT|nr:RagB/SusD family nutrient uptake outer membrane protein [Echinicola soli]QDH78964.1 RagB/SusD family nutrient uptake outer membrane protein [Echinicola soli]